jgi:NAD-dependent deacetylase
MRPMQITPNQNVVFLTGAGISVASGIRPFRGEGGLWNELDPMTHSSTEALQRDFDGVFRWHQEQAAQVATAQPNAAHLALSAFEKKHAGHVTILTQNIDSLHQRAGSSRVIEVHGSLRDLRCEDDSCEHKLEITESSIEPPRCSRCGKRMRYDVTMFGEAMPLAPLWEAKRALRACSLFVAIGTSGVVSPAAEFVREAHYAGAHTVLLNAEPHEKSNHYFLETIIGKAEEILPGLLGV